ncbi:MAG TPA: FliM/FliN family flagellar motor switch protein [Blastocatellia bacterium]|nr:FliM/FliN family flagellar motor switch protein [Blastocatellia bacterium]
MSVIVQSQETHSTIPQGLMEPFADFLDIPLQVFVELGTTKMKIRELLALEVGSVVGLSQVIGGDLLVYVNNVCIGQGLVIALDDRTCIRITELNAE